MKEKLLNHFTIKGGQILDFQIKTYDKIDPTLT